MAKRVQFASALSEVIQHCKGDGGLIPSNARSALQLSASSGWYTSKELRAIRRDIQAVVESEREKNANQGKQETRGLEIFLSKVRKELQKHYARTVLEAQRRIRHRKRQRTDVVEAQDDDALLRSVAEKYSEYARERAHQIAVRDQDDCRQINGGSNSDNPPNISQPTTNTKQTMTIIMPSTKKRVLVDKSSQRIGRKRPALQACGSFLVQRN